MAAMELITEPHKAYAKNEQSDSLKDNVKLLSITNSGIISVKLNYILSQFNGGLSLKQIQLASNKNSIKGSTVDTLIELFWSLPNL